MNAGIIKLPRLGRRRKPNSSPLLPLCLVAFAMLVVAPPITAQWAPTDIANCELWLRSHVGVTTNASGQITEWQDKSGNNHHLQGATGSYGTVVEPCSFPEKFSNPSVLIGIYYRGNTLIEAYWKSVRSPGEGLFVGEPLATPWPDKSTVSFEEGEPGG